jgi:hypothetical protein
LRLPWRHREYTSDVQGVQGWRRLELSGAAEEWIGREVVLDTAGPLVYLGRLTAVEERGFLLEGADVHNVDEGHATREQYIAESGRDGIRVNRHRVFVLRQAVTSVSPLSDVVKD